MGDIDTVYSVCQEKIMAEVIAEANAHHKVRKKQAGNDRTPKDVTTSEKLKNFVKDKSDLSASDAIGIVNSWLKYAVDDDAEDDDNVDAFASNSVQDENSWSVRSER